MSVSKRIDEIAQRRGFVPGTFMTQEEHDALVAKAAQDKANSADDDEDDEPKPGSEGWKQAHDPDDWED